MEWFEKRFIAKISKSPAVAKRVHKLMDDRFEDSKEVFKKEFSSHAVTQEIKAGPDGYNISNTLPGLESSENQNPNLWGFLGFNEGDDPISKVLGDIDDIMVWKNGRIYSKQEGKTSVIGQRYRIRMPDFGEELPWNSDLNWIDAVEYGVSGLERFVYWGGMKNSRSGAGIQSKKKILRSQSMKSVRGYFSNMQNNFKERLLKDK